MKNETNTFDKTVYYEKVLDISKLQDRKDCEIMYMKHKGSMVDLCKEALKKNIYIESISMKTYRNATGKKWWML